MSTSPASTPVAAPPRPLDHLSHSQVQRFTSCPRSWSYAYVERAPRERLPATLAFGIAVHDTLAAVNEAHLLGHTLPVRDHFVAAWRTAIAGEVPVAYGAASADDLLGTGIALVTAYRPPDDIVGVEQPFTVVLDPDLPPVTGRIDLIRRDAQGDLVLVDLKTAATRQLADTQAVAAQLALYDWAYPAVHHEAVVLGKRKTPSIVHQPITPWPLPQLLQHYREVYAAMVVGVRFAIRGWACAGCPFAERCRREGAS